MYFVEKTKGINFIKQFDYILFVSVIVLSVVGIFVLGSATRTLTYSNTIKIQIISLVLGVLICILFSAIDYKDFKVLGFIFYFASIILLVIVYFKGTGQEIWGSKSWLQIPFIGSFQPSEIAKIAVVVVTAVFFERIKEDKGNRNVLKLIIYTAIPVALVLIQPDAGTAMVFIFIFMVMVFISGIQYRYILTALGTFILTVPLLWFFILQPHQKDRIRTFMNPELDPLGAGFQVIRSKMAIGSGQIFGMGLYNGIQTQSSGVGVPVKESDFIFSVIGEELGFIGAAAVLIIIFFILLRCLYIAMNSRDVYGSFLVVGLTAMMAFHFIENIGMNMGVLPVTGIPLPFISKGGSAMITNYIAIGIILSVSIRRKRSIFNSSQ